MNRLRINNECNVHNNVHKFHLGSGIYLVVSKMWKLLLLFYHESLKAIQLILANIFSFSISLSCFLTVCLPCPLSDPVLRRFWYYGQFVKLIWIAFLFFLDSNSLMKFSILSSFFLEHSNHRYFKLYMITPMTWESAIFLHY